MDDLEIIDAFVNGGSKRAFGSGLHVEGDAMLLDGWWHTAMRISGGAAFILRNEPPPRDTTVLDDVAAVLTAKGLTNVGTDLPAITTITYTKIALGFVSWNAWATDLATAEAALEAMANEENFLEAGAFEVTDSDYSAELGGARRLAGLPASIILTVGVDDALVSPLEEVLTDCRFVSRAFGEIQPDACGSLIPTLILIDAAAQQGREFVMELRAVACGRTIPVVAITPDNAVPAGADTAVRTASDPLSWAAPIRNLLP